MANLDDHVRATFSLIKRRDVVAQAVSLVKAELSGQYHSTAKAKPEVLLNEYDRPHIAEWIAVIEKGNLMLEKFVAGTGDAPPTFWYEDISTDPTGFVDAVLKTAGLPSAALPDTDVSLKILRDEINAEWVSRYKAGR